MQQPRGGTGYVGGYRGRGPPPPPKSPYRHYQQRPRHPYSPRHHSHQPRPQTSQHNATEPLPGGREVKLISNAYSIITANTNFIIHEYDLSVEPSQGCKDLPPKCITRAYVSRSIRQLIMYDLLPRLTGAHTSPGSVIIGPSLDAIYTAQPLFLQATSSSSATSPMNINEQQQQQQEFRFTAVPVYTDLLSRLKIDIVIKFNRFVSINPRAYPGSLLSAIIHHQLMIRMMKYGSVYYHPTEDLRQSLERLDLISRHLVGISISGARRNSDDQTLVVINSSHSYITHSYRLIDLLASFISGRPDGQVNLLHDPRYTIDELRQAQIPILASIQGNEQWFATFSSMLAGFKCRALDSSGSETNLRFNLTEDPASRLLVDERTTLLEFYSQMGIVINYPNLPCLKSRSTKHPYYPLETCTLMPGQKVPIFRLGSAARNHLILMNKPNPDISKNTSSQARDEVASINKSQFDAFGLRLSQDPIEASGWTLNKPMLQYKNQTVEPRRDFWESGVFYHSNDLMENWCVVDTVGLDVDTLMLFLQQFGEYSTRFGLNIGPPMRLAKPKQELLDEPDSIESLIKACSGQTKRRLRFVLFIIDSTSTQLNRMIHLAFDDHPTVTATCLRSESVLNQRQQRSIFRTLVHKLNARLGGTNHTYNDATWERLNLDARELMIVGLDVTHPDNELNGVSIVGCAYTYCDDLFRHKSLVWPQAARKEIIMRMDFLMERLLSEYVRENGGSLPKHIIVYRDGVSNEEFERVRMYEITKALRVIEEAGESRPQDEKPQLSYIIAQKRHTMRFYQQAAEGARNPQGGTIINQGIVQQEESEFYLYSNTSPQATARPLHYHILLNNLGLDNLQKLTYYLCFNFGKCSSSLSMPSSLRYAHNAAYDARNRVIASKEFSENKFYTTKFFC